MGELVIECFEAGTLDLLVKRVEALGITLRFKTDKNEKAKKSTTKKKPEVFSLTGIQNIQVLNRLNLNGKSTNKLCSVNRMKIQIFQLMIVFTKYH